MFIEAKKLPGYTVRALSEGALQTSKFVMDYHIPFKLSKTPTDFINFIHPYFSLSDSDKKSEVAVRNALCKYADLASTAKSLLTEVSRNKFYIDGIELVSGKVVLLKDQDVKSENGVYTVTVTSEVKQETIETVITNYTEYTIVFSRASYTATELQGLTIYVTDGTVNKESSWTQVSHDIVIGTTDIVFLNAPSFWDIFRNLVTTVHIKDSLSLSNGTQEISTIGDWDIKLVNVWNNLGSYKLGEYVSYHGKIYKCIGVNSIGFTPAANNDINYTGVLSDIESLKEEEITIQDIYEGADGNGVPINTGKFKISGSISGFLGNGYLDIPFASNTLSFLLNSSSIPAGQLHTVNTTYPGPYETVYKIYFKHPHDSSAWENVNMAEFNSTVDYSVGDLVINSNSTIIYEAKSNISKLNLIDTSSMPGIKSHFEFTDGLSIIRYVSLSNKEKAIKIRLEDNSPIPQWYVDQLIIDHGYSV